MSSGAPALPLEGLTVVVPPDVTLDDKAQAKLDEFGLKTVASPDDTTAFAILTASKSDKLSIHIHRICVIRSIGPPFIVWNSGAFRSFLMPVCFRHALYSRSR